MLTATELLNSPGVYYIGGNGSSATGVVFEFEDTAIYAVAFTNPIAVVCLPRDAQLKPVLLGHAPYPMQLAAVRMLNSGFAMSERAAEVLRGLA